MGKVLGVEGKMEFWRWIEVGRGVTGAEGGMGFDGVEAERPREDGGRIKVEGGIAGEVGREFELGGSIEMKGKVGLERGIKVEGGGMNVGGKPEVDEGMVENGLIGLDGKELDGPPEDNTRVVVVSPGAGGRQVCGFSISTLSSLGL